MPPLVFSALLISGGPALGGLRAQPAPTRLTRSVRYPRAEANGHGEGAHVPNDTMRSVRYPRRWRAARWRGGSSSVVIGLIPRRTVPALSPVRRRVVYRLGAKGSRDSKIEAPRPPRRAGRYSGASHKAPRERRVLMASRLPAIWLPPPRRKIIHHQDHRLPPSPSPTPGWEPRWDRRPFTKPILAISSQACLARLRHLRVAFRRARPRRGLVTPVVITGPVNGLKLTPMWGRRPALMDCRFALILYRIAPIIRRVGVDELRYSGFYSYRYVSGTGRLSRHSNGMAADIFEVRGPDGLRANVLKDWVKAKGRPGDCVAGVTSRKGSVLRRLACGLENSGILFQVLTPDSNYAHRNHYHISGLRVGERPLKNRYAGRRVRVRRD